MFIKFVGTTLLCLLSLFTYSQSTVYVTPTGAGNNSGSSWDNALPGSQLQSRLASATSGSQFWLAGGNYSPGIQRTSTFQIPSGVQVYGGFSGIEFSLSSRSLSTPSSTTLTGEVGDPNTIGDNLYHVVTFIDASSSTRLDGIVITGGNANANTEPHNSGGGVYNAATSAISGTSTFFTSSPTLVNCLLIDNSAAKGAGLYNQALSQNQCSPAIIQCIFSGNKASISGGGCYSYSYRGNCSPSFFDCKFVRNESAEAGAFLGTASMTEGNSSPVFSRCLFDRNRATTGSAGAVSFSSGFYALVNPSVLNCVFSNNLAATSGGAATVYAVYGGNTNSIFTNCTFADNTAPSGKDLFSTRYIDSQVTTYLTNCILGTNNLPYDTGNNKTAPTYTVTYSNIRGGYAGTGNIDEDPLFVDAANGNYRLLRNSPSVNAGDPNSTTANVSPTDFGGGARVYDNRVDMGAYEFAPFADLRMALSVSNRTIAVNQPVTYNLSITNDGPEPATGVAWSNQLPSNIEFVSGGNGVSNSFGYVYGSVASLSPGATAMLTYQAKPDRSGQYINAAEITYSNQPDPDSQPFSGIGDGQDDTAQADFRTTDGGGATYVTPNPNQVPLPPVASNQPAPDPNKADLSLLMAASNRVAKIGDVITLTYRVLNAGGLTATGVALKVNLPAGVSFVSGAGFTKVGQIIVGNVGSVDAGWSFLLTAQVRVDSTDPGPINAEISASNQPDPDSQPDSGFSNGEDDTATIDLRVIQ